MARIVPLPVIDYFIKLAMLSHLNDVIANAGKSRICFLLYFI